MASVKPGRVAVRLSILVACLAVLALVVALKRSRETQRRQSALRAAGLPTTLAEFDAFYRPVPDPENLAPPLLAAIGILNATASSNLPFLSRHGDPVPGVPWTEAQRAAARGFREREARALDALHDALKRPGFRAPIRLTSGASTTLPHLAPIRGAGNVISLETWLAVEEGRSPDALRGIGESLHLADALDSEPLLISHLVASGIRTAGIRSAEHLLSRVALDEGSLSNLQATLLRNGETMSLTSSFAGQGVLLESMFQLTYAQFERQTGGFSAASSPGFYGALGLGLYWTLGLKNRDRAVALDYIDQLLAASRMEADAQAPAARKAQEEWEQRMGRSRTPFAQEMMKGAASGFEGHLRNLALLRAAATACAVERFRLAHGGARPGALGELVPRFLESVPRDPKSGEPLAYVVRDSGYWIHGAGTNLRDDGGAPSSDDDAIRVNR